MDVLFLIGNGFDINLGMPTDYQSFYDFYLKQKSDTEAISKMKQFLTRERYESWSDLEWGLGQYTAEVSSIGELEELYFDLGDQLRSYLERLSSSLSVSQEMKNAISRGLREPYSFLPDGMRREISSFVGSQVKNVSIITFNYTDTLEKILVSYSSSLSLPNSLDVVTTLGDIRHIHMSLKDPDFIMGVNDVDQIKNKALINDACLRLLVKPHINQQMQNLVDDECLAMINNADLFCLFGLSLGETDKMWWEAIGDRMTHSKARLIYYLFDNKPVRRNSQLIARMDDARSLLIERFGMEKAPENLLRRIYVGYNTNVFKVE